MKLKLNTKDQDIWFSSDFHVNHNKDFIYEKRGFKTIQEHNDALIVSINESVKERDILFHLGDMFLNSTPESMEEFLSKLKCKRIYALYGNHPGPLKNRYKFKQIINLTDFMEIYVDGKYVTLCHYPMYAWDKSHRGAYQLCGHNHMSLDYSHPDKGIDRCMDVGIDYNFKPWKWQDIDALLSTRLLRENGHHVKDMQEDGTI